MTATKAPVRTCVACRVEKDKTVLVRIVRAGSGAYVDPTGKAAGRGAYVCADAGCLDPAIKRGRIAKSLGISLAADAYTEIARDFIKLIAEQKVS